jgi:ribosomal protein S18 acetylase RimI-like enzyme
MTLPMRDGDWTLELAKDDDIREVMTWFPDADSVNIWGGPAFRYPFTEASFREDCRLDVTEAYALRNGDGALAAFGQSYDRDGRGHLARLVSNPRLRRQGAGRQLIRMIVTSLAARRDYDEYSLFVYRDNEPACRCYLSLGFVVREYPEDAPMPDQCYFLTRKGGLL